MSITIRPHACYEGIFVLVDDATGELLKDGTGIVMLTWELAEERVFELTGIVCGHCSSGFHGIIRHESVDAVRECAAYAHHADWQSRSEQSARLSGAI